jgi:nucleotide-binding universal stress UspA family protein
MGWNFNTKEIPVEILICTDGSVASLQSAVLVHKLMFPATTKVVILGVSEKPADYDILTSSSDQLQEELKGIYQTSTKMRSGKPYEEILAEALEFSYDLVAVGGAGKHLGILNSQLGSTTSYLARKLHTHFLVVREVPAQINRVLVCVSGEAAAGDTIKIGGAWISHSAREVTILHVIPSKKKVPVNQIKNLTTHQNLPQTQATVDSGELEQAVQQLQQSGVTGSISTKIRSGLIVDEVLTELSQGNYDLMVVGAHFKPGKNRWHGLLLDDITDQLLNRSSCSVMII